MKLATLNNSRPDGQLVVISNDLSQFVSAGRIAPDLQTALDDWQTARPALQRLGDDLNVGAIAGQPFDPANALAPLPRAYQWIDAGGYLSHLERVRTLKGSKDAELQDARPLFYQGASDSLLGATAPIEAASEKLAIDFEAEIAAILGPVAKGASRKKAAAAIRLFALCNDVSLRRLVAGDLVSGFGFFHAKPATSFAPVVVTPDELGSAWQGNKVRLTINITVNKAVIGRLDSGADMHFDFADLIAAAARTRHLGAGTLLGGGTISNRHDEVLPITRDGKGFGCLAEARTVEKIKFGKARTRFLKAGDHLRIIAVDQNDRPVFGTIDQTVIIGQPGPETQSP